MSAPVPLLLTDRIALTLDGLCRAVAARVAGGALAVAMIILIWKRVKRIEGQIQRLLARFRAGRLWVRTASPAGVRGGGRRVASARLPRRFAWLLGLVPQHAAGFASQFQGVLDDPEMQALLAVSAPARRVLAPLCRMLGIEAEVLGVRPEGPASKRPEGVRTRVRTPRAKVDWGRIPLPRGVLTWARREGFGKAPLG